MKIYYGMLLQLMAIIIFAIMYYFMEKSNFKGMTDNLIDPLYFSVVNHTTIGYGDIVPVTRRAKILTMLQIFTLFFLISLHYV